MTAKKLLVAAALVLFAFPVAAEEEEDTSRATENRVSSDGSVIRGSANSPWRGSSISYDHASTTLSLDKGAEPTYNPYYAHSLSLAPRYYVSDDLFLALSWTMEQELTNSDWTTSENALMWSDVFLDAGWSGFSEKNTGIRMSASLRLGLPASELSQAQTQFLSLAPSVRFSRRFDVLNGLTLAWSARYSQRFHSETTARYEAGGVTNCGDACDRLRNTGLLNSWGDFSTGPSIQFLATDKLVFTADMRWGQAWVYENAAYSNPFTGEIITSKSDFAGRYNSYFGLGASYDLLDELSIAASVATPSPQLGADGQRRSPFFNRFTQIGVGLTLNIDPLAARLLSRG